MCGSRKFRQVEGGGPEIVFSHRRISQRAVRTSLERQKDPRGTIASRKGSVPVFLRKNITTSDFSERGGPRTPVITMDPRMCMARKSNNQ